MSISGHFWIEDSNGKVLYDPHFDEYNFICALRGADITKPIYRKASPARQREMFKKWVLPILADKETKEFVAMLKSTNTLPPSFSGACQANATTWKMVTGRGTIVYGDRGWATKDGGEWIEFEDGWTPQSLRQHCQDEIDRGRLTKQGRSWSDFKIVDHPDGNGFTMTKFKNLD